MSSKQELTEAHEQIVLLARELGGIYLSILRESEYAPPEVKRRNEGHLLRVGEVMDRSRERLEELQKQDTMIRSRHNGWG